MSSNRYVRQRTSGAGEIDTVRALLHDLREPVSAIIMLAEAPVGDVTQNLNCILAQARWLNVLVETVLDDAANDALDRVDACDIATSLVLRTRETTTCDVVVGGDSTHVLARPIALRRALACVLDNAIRAAGADGHVVVKITSDGADVHVLVIDDGPGLGKVAARTSLGLTITRAMVAACHGSFRLRPGASGGAVADIRLRRADLERVAS